MTAIDQDIGVQIDEFLHLTLEKVKPTWIVTVERKGTALLRTVFDNHSHREVCLDWGNVLSSDAINSFPSERLREGAILLLDDGIHGGGRVSQALDVLTREKKVPREHIKIASFSVHEDSTFEGIDFHWFGRLRDSQYRRVRTGVIEFFQRRGSLLLDTEHIEVSVELHCGRLEFFDALCRAGLGVEHTSEGGHVNLTIHNPIILDETTFTENLPPRTMYRDVVRKIRVVERKKSVCNPPNFLSLYTCQFGYRFVVYFETRP